MKTKIVLLFSVLILVTFNSFSQSESQYAVISEGYQKLWTPSIKARIHEGIERNRKGEATLKILDKNGQPLKDVQISINQISHEFLFGCNLFVLVNFKLLNSTPNMKRLLPTYSTLPLSHFIGRN
jgi:hypothetical protein